jgi:hypothetical protein
MILNAREQNGSLSFGLRVRSSSDDGWTPETLPFSIGLGR